MTLFDIFNAVKERFPNTDIKEVCQLVNELESRLVSEIFSPHGIAVRTQRLNEETDTYTPLLLEEENILLYVYFSFSILSLKEMDFEAANAYSTAFNQKFSELSTLYRRNYTPINNVQLSGGV